MKKIDNYFPPRSARRKNNENVFLEEGARLVSQLADQQLPYEVDIGVFLDDIPVQATIFPKSEKKSTTFRLALLGGKMKMFFSRRGGVIISQLTN